jgi:DNA-binding MarR family transcriptional regulator
MEDYVRHPAHELFVQVLLFAREIIPVMERELAPVTSLTFQEMHLLRSVVVDGPRTIGQLRYRQQVTRQYVHTTLKSLESQGLVERQANPRHKRSPLFAATEAGQQLWRSIHDRSKEAVDPFTQDIASEDVATTTATLKALREKFRSHRVSSERK